VKAYRDKQLPNPVMQSIASRLKDDEIEALAHFAVTKQP
jgi:cytochrome c553